LELITDFHDHLRSLVEAIFSPHAIDHIGDINELFGSVNFFIQVILDDFEQFLKDLDTVSNVLADKIPLIDKFFVFSLDL
jgi:hypothetical protein